MDPQTIGTVIATIVMVIYFGIKAIKDIAEHFGWFSKKAKEKLEQQATRRQTEIKQIVDESINSQVPKMLEPLLNENKGQNARLDLLTESTKDGLRNHMTQIYYKYLPYKKILYYDKENFLHMYADYKAEGGNSYIDEIKKDLSEFEVVRTIEELNK